MANEKTRTVLYRRKGAGKTDYRKRLGLLKSHTPRLVVRVSLKNVIAQAVSFSPEGDRIIASAHSHDLKKLGWPYAAANQPAAYLVGMLAGKRAKKAKLSTLIPDLGAAKPIRKSVKYAVLKGAKDAGIHVPVDDSVLPDAKRVAGEHISEYGKKLKAGGLYEKQFSAYLKSRVDTEDIPRRFEEIKTKILKEH